MRINTRIFLTVIFLTTNLPAHAERPFKTDDPWQERLYGWEVNAGMIVGSGSWEKIEDRNQVDIVAGVDYGFSERSEVGLAWNAFRMQKPGLDGFSDATLHYKHRMVEAHASSPDISLDVRLKLPTGNRRRGLGSGKADLGLISLYGWKGERWTTTARLGYTISGAPQDKHRLEVGLATRYKASEVATFLGELYSDSNEKRGLGTRLEMSAGMKFEVGPATWFDLLAIVGLSESVPDAGFTVGMTSRL